MLKKILFFLLLSNYSFGQIGYNPVPQKQWFKDTIQVSKSIRYNVGSSLNGKVLTSDAEGRATWQTGGGGGTGSTGATGATGSTGATGGTGATGATAGVADGWTEDLNTWTYSSDDGATGVVTINADLTGIIQAGDRIKFTQTTVKYFIVTATPTYSAGNTTLTFWGGTDYTLANAAISATYYSHAKVPFGFNTNPDKWTVTVSDNSSYTQSSPVNGTWYNLGSINITIPIGIWTVRWVSVLNISVPDIFQFPLCKITLSTANNSESDVYFTSIFGAGVNSGSYNVFSVLTAEQILPISTKTTYYLNGGITTSTTISAFRFRGDLSPIIIKATCAYL